MKAKRSATAEKVALARRAVADAKQAHRAAFREALAALFTEYGLCLEADGDLGAYLKIVELGEFQKEYSIKDLPE